VNKAGLALLVVGIGIMIWAAFGFKTRETVLDVGPIHATREKTHDVPYGPLIGGLVAIAGVVLMVKGKA
jgi:hypothetical protein